MVSWNGYTIATRPREILERYVTDEALLARLGLRRHSLALSKSVLLEIAFGELYLQKP
jgi:hypothetical protein